MLKFSPYGRKYARLTDATVKLLIAKGVFTDDEFKAQLSTKRANYLAVLKQLH